MNPSTFSKLDELFAEFPFMKSGTVSLDELLKAEKVLGVKFADDYKELVQKYGGAVVGPFPIYGLRHAGPMDDHLWSIVDVTMQYRNEGWPETQESYIVSSDHAGNPIAITKNGRVVSYDHDVGELVDIADSFECFVLQCLEPDNKGNGPDKTARPLQTP